MTDVLERARARIFELRNPQTIVDADGRFDSSAFFHSKADDEDAVTVELPGGTVDLTTLDGVVEKAGLDRRDVVIEFLGRDELILKSAKAGTVGYYSPVAGGHYIGIWRALHPDDIAIALAHEIGHARHAEQVGFDRFWPNESKAAREAAEKIARAAERDHAEAVRACITPSGGEHGPAIARVFKRGASDPAPQRRGSWGSAPADVWPNPMRQPTRGATLDPRKVGT
jgi:hypothetical protein